MTAELVDCGSVSDTFVTKLARIDDLGPCRRLVFSTPHKSTGETFDMVVAYIVVPTEMLPLIARLLQSAPGDCALFSDGPAPRLAN